MDLVAATTAAFDGARAAAAERRGMRPACTAAECAKWYAGARAPDALRTLGALLAEGEAARVGRHHTPGGPFVGGAPSTALTSRGGATTSAVPESPHPQSPHSPVLGFDPPPLLPSDPSECLHLGLALAGRCAALLAGYAHSAEAAYAASLAPWLRQFPFLPLPPSSDPPVAALSPPPLPLPNPPAVAPTPPHPHSHPTSPSLPPHLTPPPPHTKLLRGSGRSMRASRSAPPCARSSRSSSGWMGRSPSPTCARHRAACGSPPPARASSSCSGTGRREGEGPLSALLRAALTALSGAMLGAPLTAPGGAPGGAPLRAPGGAPLRSPLASSWDRLHSAVNGG